MSTYTCRAAYCTEPVDGCWDVCAVCWNYRRAWLDGMPAAWMRAKTLLVPGRGANTEFVRTSRPSSRPPLRMGPLNAMTDALMRLDMWANTVVRLGAPVDPPPPWGQAREQIIFDRSMAILTEYDYLVERSGLAGDYYVSIYAAYWRLTKLDRDTLAFTKVAMPCPRCGTYGLLERHAGEITHCLTCDALWTQAAFLTFLSNGCET